MNPARIQSGASAGSSATAPEPFLASLLSTAPDLVRDTRLETAFAGRATIHYHDESASSDSASSEEEGEDLPPAGDEDNRQHANPGEEGAASSAGGRRRHRSRGGAGREERWEWERLIRRGGCGEVWLQRCADGEGEEGSGSSSRAAKAGAKTTTRRRAGRAEKRAVKMIPLGVDLARADGGGKVNFISELEALAKFSQKRYSRHFVKLLGWYYDHHSLFIAMEYFPLGDLQAYMTEFAPMPETDAREIAHQVMQGLGHMHGEGFAHRDVKPGNVLIEARPPQQRRWRVKISDFGISKRTAAGGAEQLSTVKGTLPYLAPELWGHEPGSPYAVDHQAADMWALGEMVFRMLTKSAAFPSHPVLFRYLSRPDTFPSDRLTRHQVSPEADDFVRQLMRPGPEQRMSSGAALGHAWLLPCRPKNPVGASSQFLLLSSMSSLPIRLHSTTKSSDPEPNVPVHNVAVDPWATVSSAASNTWRSGFEAEQDSQDLEDLVQPPVPPNMADTPPSQIKTSETHLFVAARQLLETLTQWSRGQASESEVVDMYVRLGYEFNKMCRAFWAINVDTSDLGNVLELLRSILETTLAQEASVESLEKYLPRIRDIVINMLHGLRKKQRLWHEQAREKDGGGGPASRRPVAASPTPATLIAIPTGSSQQIPIHRRPRPSRPTTSAEDEGRPSLESEASSAHKLTEEQGIAKRNPVTGLARNRIPHASRGIRGIFAKTVEDPDALVTKQPAPRTMGDQAGDFSTPTELPSVPMPTGADDFLGGSRRLVAANASSAGDSFTPNYAINGDSPPSIWDF